MLTSTWLRALLATNRQGMTQAQQRDGLRPQAEMGLWIYKRSELYPLRLEIAIVIVTKRFDGF